jgi:hypothetical protein
MGCPSMRIGLTACAHVERAQHVFGSCLGCPAEGMACRNDHLLHCTTDTEGQSHGPTTPFSYHLHAALTMLRTLLGPFLGLVQPPRRCFGNWCDCILVSAAKARSRQYRKRSHVPTLNCYAAEQSYPCRVQVLLVAGPQCAAWLSVCAVGGMNRSLHTIWGGFPHIEPLGNVCCCHTASFASSGGVCGRTTLPGPAHGRCTKVPNLAVQVCRSALKAQHICTTASLPAGFRSLQFDAPVASNGLSIMGLWCCAPRTSPSTGSSSWLTACHTAQGSTCIMLGVYACSQLPLAAVFCARCASWKGARPLLLPIGWPRILCYRVLQWKVHVPSVRFYQQC